MSNSYKLSVNNSTFFDLSESNIENLDAVSLENDKFHVLKDNQSYQAEIISKDFLAKKYKVKVNNNTYEVAISNPLDLLIKEMGFEVGVAKQISAIKAPMPGLILEINVEVGQTVKENDNLLILTAMKMENSLLSPRDGIVKSVAIKVGESVVKGALLIEFE